MRTNDDTNPPCGSCGKPLWAPSLRDDRPIYPHDCPVRNALRTIADPTVGQYERVLLKHGTPEALARFREHNGLPTPREE